MAEMKRCKQCGLLKETTEFRQYTYSKQNETPGRYRTCKACENINQAYRKNLRIVEALMYVDTPEKQKAANFIKKIASLYDVLEKRGLLTPRNSSPTSDAATNTLEYLTDFYEVSTATAPRNTVVVSADSLPDDLQSWLTAPVETWIENDISPEYLQETIYESLKAKYRPQTGYDMNRGIPLYDDTYKTVLNNILKRFDEYEETYAAEEQPE